MKKLISNICTVVAKHYLPFLFIFVLISYGQILFMQPWQEDNVVFFKMAHINERAGYMGTNMWGEGPYRFIITPYYLLYKIFGYTTPVFYLLAFTAFFFACAALYFLFKNLINKRAGILVSLLFGAGYVAYDGFVRIYNSTSASLGIITLCFVLVCYWNFYKKRKLIWYLGALVVYFLAIQLSYIRMHYLIVPLVFFEVIFFIFPLKFSNVIKSIIRVVPFVFIFFNQYVGGDTREDSIATLVKALLAGKFENTFSFTSTLGNLFVLDKIQELIAHKNLVLPELFLLGALTLAIYLINKKNKRRFLFTVISAIAGLTWILISNKLYSDPSLIYSSPQSILASFLAGIFLILITNIVFLLKGIQRKLIIFFLVVVTANIAAYAAYTPLTPYGSGYRYLTHSYIGFIGILVIIVEFASKRLNSKLPIYIYSILILITLSFGITNLNNIVVTKSQRISLFYNQLKTSVPEFPKGSVLYFDIKDDPIAKSFYAVSFSVAEMPDTTAIAWRYGIDRYDLTMFTDFDQFVGEIKESNTPLSKVFTFYISEKGLTNTSGKFRPLASSGSVEKSMRIVAPILSDKNNDSEIKLEQPISGLTPVEVTLGIRATSKLVNQNEFPILTKDTTNQIYSDLKLSDLAFSYQKSKKQILQNSLYTASSQWKERVISNINDNNPDTVWQADRVTWDKEETFVKIDMKRVENVSSVAWINGYPNNTPTKLKVLTSADNENWNDSAATTIPSKIVDSSIQTISFNPINARYVKIVINETINDSPAISEIWPVPSLYKDLSIGEAEEFLKNPFLAIYDLESYTRNLKRVNYTGQTRVSWKSDKGEKWQTSNNSVLSLYYDNIYHIYKITIPQSGTEIREMKLSEFTIPGSAVVNYVSTKNLSIYQ